MTIKDPAASSPRMEDVCETLDKLMVKQLHLMETKMQHELNIEKSINSGSLHLAKARYIMGHNSVSSTKLPGENSNDFSASTICEKTDQDGVEQLKIVEKTDSEDTVNPMRWFGVLVPQNLHKAQSIFQNALNYVVECVNVQLQIQSNLENIEILKRFKLAQSDEECNGL